MSFLPLRQSVLVTSVLSIVLLCLAGCSGPQIQRRPETPPAATYLADDAVVTQDGYRLPLRHWLPDAEPRAAVLALHGFNDYGNAFATTARHLNGHAITLYAIDQRGFGASAHAGLWAGSDIMQDDLLTTARLLCRRHADIPLYLLGESMGGAVILAASARLAQTCVEGVILSAPAVWGWQTMPWWQAAALRMAAHLTPAWKVTGEGLDIRPSDNIEMLRALGRDPLVIKRTRIDTIYGLTDLMQTAFENSGLLHLPTLLLYGEHDEIIRPVPVCKMLQELGNFNENGWKMLLYPDGFHMLTRDLQAAVVLGDMAAWIGNPETGSPSGLEVGPGEQRLTQVCNGD